VCVVGAAGGIGQPLSLLLKANPLVTTLSCYDLAPVTPGVAADLSHVNTGAKVEGHTGETGLASALRNADLVVVPAGVPRKPGMTRDDLFNVNANINYNVAVTAAKECPNAAFLIISNPVNSTVPIWAEALKKAGKYNPKKLFGVTTLDVCRANTFVAENQKTDVNKTVVPVVGGHAGTTILPLLSQATPSAKFTPEDKAALTQRIMFGGDEVVKAKAGAGSATLSMAFAGAHFANQVMRGLKGEANVVECTYVESNVVPNTRFFASKVTLGKNGVEKIHDLGKLDEFEQQKLKEMLPDLQSQIEKGVEFVKSK
jgi:malate dehydrogenase